MWQIQFDLIKGRRQVREGFLSLETTETWIVYVCHSEGLWTGCGSSCQAHRFEYVDKHWWVSCVYPECSTTQRTSSQLDTTVGPMVINIGLHPCGTLLTPCSQCPMNWGCSEGKKGVHLNIRKVFRMFFTLIVNEEGQIMKQSAQALVGKTALVSHLGSFDKSQGQVVELY